MDGTDQPSLYLGLAKLSERRPISPEEHRRVRRTFRTAVSRLVMFALSLLAAYACAFVAHRSFDVSAEVAIIAGVFYSVIALGAFLLLGRDWILAVQRTRGISDDAEVLKFVSGESVHPKVYYVVHPANLLIATHHGPEFVPFPVEPTQVAPNSKRTQSVLEWMESENIIRANRMLEAEERQEIQRVLAKLRIRVEWWEPLLLIWALAALGTVLAGKSPSLLQTILRVFVFSMVWSAEVTRWTNFIRARRTLRISQNVGIVRIARGPAGYSEVLLPLMLPWTIDGTPADWRRS